MTSGESPVPLVVDPLLPAVAAGDLSAMRACIGRYGALIWTMARRFSPTSEDAEDAVQEIFLDLWKDAAKFNPLLGSEKVFVTVCARRHLIDRLRSWQRLRNREVLADGSQPLIAPPVDRAERDAEVEEARTALALLPPSQQRVIAMALVLGLSQTEIASETGLPLGTVKTMIRRGIQSLRERLAPRADNEPDAGETP
jgi:RNA polymerase sigma-70 factor, ECF subfamily